MNNLKFEEGKDILIKLDKDQKVTGIYGMKIDPKTIQEALLVSLIKVCQARGVDWKGVLFGLGLHAYQREFDKEKDNV